ncbi:MAG: GNAT family N-acetyltransferase [Thermoplasmata archaeon]|nr:MAG: GNAT family N-acetyltransferase [Thermoplasmata archaeon]
MIRKIRSEDIPDVMRLLEQLWPDIHLDPKEIKTILDKYIQNDDYDIYCYEEQKVQGIITITKRDAFYYGGKVAIIEDLIVDKKYRGQEIGRKLVEFVEKELKQNGIRAIELSSNLHRDRAHEFWERMDYKKSGYESRKIFI